MAQLTIETGGHGHKFFDYGRVSLLESFPVSSDELEKVKLQIDAQLDHDIAFYRMQEDQIEKDKSDASE